MIIFMSTTHLQQTAGAKGQDDKADRRHLSLQYCSHQELYVSGKKKQTNRGSSSPATFSALPMSLSNSHACFELPDQLLCRSPE